MVLELLDLFHLGCILYLIVGYAIFKTSLRVFRRLSGLIKMRSADLIRVFESSAGS